MPNPTHSHVIRGTVYSTITKGRSEVRVTIDDSVPDQKQDIYIGGSTQTEKGLVLFVKNLNTGEVYPRDTDVTTSSSSGKYLFDCKNFAQGFENGHIIQIVASNVTDSLHDSEEGDLQREHELISARRRLLVDREGNEIDSDNPLPVFMVTDNLFEMNGDMDYTHDSSGRITKETKTIKGVVYSRTYTYTGNNYYADRISKWTKD